jgi:hypothetical protein
MVVFFVVFASIPAHAYTMANYWAFNEGNIWVYDRDLQLMGSNPFKVVLLPFSLFE